MHILSSNIGIICALLCSDAIIQPAGMGET